MYKVLHLQSFHMKFMKVAYFCFINFTLTFVEEFWSDMVVFQAHFASYSAVTYNLVLSCSSSAFVSGNHSYLCTLQYMYFNGLDFQIC